MAGQPKTRIGWPWAKHQLSGPSYRTTRPQPSEGYTARQRKKKPLSERESGCDEQMDRAWMTAESQPLQCAHAALNVGPTAPMCELDT